MEAHEKANTFEIGVKLMRIMEMNKAADLLILIILM